MAEEHTQTSERGRLVALVKAYAEANSLPQGKVWNLVYAEFEHRTNTAWRKVAYNAGRPVVAVVVDAGGLAKLLECATAVLGGEA